MRLAEAREAAGVSSLTLVHYRVNSIGDVQTEQPAHCGLSQFGRDVVAECNALGVVIDCAHASFETTAGVLAHSNDPVMVSHSHLDHADRHHPRLLSAEHARAVASSGGLIGAWPSGITSSSLSDFADEVVRLVDLIGIDHVTIGTDMDGNFRPVVRSYADFATLPQLLTSRGLSDGEIDKILGTNALELLRAVASWPSAPMVSTNVEFQGQSNETVPAPAAKNGVNSGTTSSPQSPDARRRADRPRRQQQPAEPAGQARRAPSALAGEVCVRRPAPG